MSVRRLVQVRRFWRADLPAGLLLLLTLALLSCARQSASSQLDDAAVAVGRRLYVANCTVCHGEQGDKVPEAPLNHRQFLDSRGNAMLLHAVAEGKGIMPAWGETRGGPLTWIEIDSVVAYLNWTAGRTSPSLLANSGRNVFYQQCARCHGDRGDRIPVAPLAAKPFLDARTDDQLIRVISDGKGLMPAFRAGSASPLTEDQVTAVVSYIRYNATASVAEEVRRGRQLYASNCLPCHGEQGDRVPNVALASANDLRQLGDGGVTSTIADGKGVMPAFASSRGGSFQVAELAALLTYLKYWAGLPVGSALGGADAPPEAKALYARNCAGCHGESGEKVAGVRLKSHAYLDSRSDDILARQIGQGNAHGMPAWGQTTGGPLLEQEIRGIIAFLRSDAKAVAVAVAPVADTDLSTPHGDIAARGKQLFRRSCVACHGDGRNKVAAANLADPPWLAARGDEALAQGIAYGKGSMPSWGKERGGPLADTDIQAIVAYLKAAAASPQLATDVASPAVRDEIILSAEAKAGQRIFAKNCVACHGDGRTGIAAAKLSNADWLLQRGDAALRQSISTGKGAMPSMSQEKGGPLNDNDIAAALAYLKETAGIARAR